MDASQIQMLSVGAVILLIVFGLAAGVGITAIGPGGVLVTIALFTFTDLPPAGVAGTAIVTQIATGLLGSAAYYRSGQLREPATRRTALILAGAAVVGTPIGIQVTTTLSSRAYGLLLAGLVGLTGVLVLLRQRRTSRGHGREEPHQNLRPAVVISLGVGVGAASGLFGIGGPILTVPLLLALGIPMLRSLGAAQAQSVVIASVGTIGYAAHGAVDWPLAALVGIPQLLGVIAGWRLARSASPRALGYTLAVVLLVLAPYLALRS